MSRPAVAATCAAVLLAGFIAGRITGGGANGTVTVRETIERSVVVSARHVGSARDPHDSGPLDLARVGAVRRGTALLTTITARSNWRDSLLGRGGVKLSILYDTNDDGRTDQRDHVFLFHGQLASWISDFGQGVQAADVTRRSGTTIAVARDVTVFFNRAGEASRLMTSPIGVAVARAGRGAATAFPTAVGLPSRLRSFADRNGRLRRSATAPPQRSRING